MWRRLLLRLRLRMNHPRHLWLIRRRRVRTLRLLVSILGLLVLRRIGLLLRRRWRVLSLLSP